ncbi:MAG: DUF4391 domain-containing protein [Bacillota bacterium]
MLAFPKSTEYGRRIPKNKFYEHLPVTQEIKRLFIDQIAGVTWRNKLSPETLNVEAGKRVREIEVIAIQLNQRDIDRRVLQLIDKGIPYHLLFQLEHCGKVQLRIGFKEQGAAGADSFKVLQYYQTEWSAPEDIIVALNGLNMDALYDNLIVQIAGDVLDTGQAPDLKTAIDRQAAMDKLIKQIATLENKRNQENQLNRQIEINAQIKALKRKLEEM